MLQYEVLKHELNEKQAALDELKDALRSSSISGITSREENEVWRRPAESNGETRTKR